MESNQGGKQSATTNQNTNVSGIFESKLFTINLPIAFPNSVLVKIGAAEDLQGSGYQEQIIFGQGAHLSVLYAVFSSRLNGGSFNAFWMAVGR